MPGGRWGLRPRHRQVPNVIQRRRSARPAERAASGQRAASRGRGGGGLQKVADRVVHVVNSTDLCVTREKTPIPVVRLAQLLLF